MVDPFAFSDPHQRELAATLEFGPDELDSNREGTLTPAQIKRLETDLRWMYWPVICLVSGLALIVAMYGAINGPSGWMVPATVLAAGAILAAFWLRLERLRLPDAEVRATMLRLGRLSLGIRRLGIMVDDDTGPERTHYPVESGRSLFATNRLYKVLRANQPYRVYYAPVRVWGGLRLLSIEPVGKPDSTKSKRDKHKPKRST
ncbi:MAG: hypothetical protein JXJ20_06240 [Anaerolineae bacterium]|nr:hypothetical protein [Anaerolineae bacterium]